MGRMYDIINEQGLLWGGSYFRKSHGRPGDQVIILRSRWTSDPADASGVDADVYEEVQRKIGDFERKHVNTKR